MSAEAEADTSNDEAKRRRPSSNSRGNVFTLPQQKKAKKVITRVSNDDMYNVVDNLCHCRPRGAAAAGCIKKAFSQFHEEGGLAVNMADAFNCVSECHEEYHLTKHDPVLETAFH
jgi:hypothetical protein